MGKKKSSPVTMIIGLILALLCIVLLVVSYMGGGSPKPATQKFDAIAGGDEPGYLDIAELYYFDKIDSSNHRYYIALDTGNYLFLVKMDVNDESNYQDILDYVNGVTDDVPVPVRMEGMPKRIDSSAIDETLREIRAYLPGLEEIIFDENSFYDYFGYYYMDMTAGGVSPLASYRTVIIVGLVCGLLIFIPSLIARGKSGKGDQVVLSRFASEIPYIDNELNLPNTLAMDDIGVYVTPSYILSTMGGLQINRLSEVTNLTTAFNNNMHMINLSTSDGQYRVLAGYPSQQQADAAFYTIKSQLDSFLSGGAGIPQAAAPVTPATPYPAAPDATGQTPPAPPFQQTSSYPTAPTAQPTPPTTPYAAPQQPAAPTTPQPTVPTTPHAAPSQPAAPTVPQVPQQPTYPESNPVPPASEQVDNKYWNEPSQNDWDKK